MLRLALPLCLLSVAAAQDAPDALKPYLGTSPIEVRLDPATELWFEVRTRAASDEEPAEDDPLAAAIASARELGAMFSDEAAWLQVDQFILRAKLPGRFGNVFVEKLRVPPQFRVAGVGPARVPTVSLELAMALDAAAPSWLEDAWPARRERLEVVRAQLLELLPPSRQAEIFAELENLLRLPFPSPSFPLRLTTRMPEVQEIALWIGAAPTMTALVAVQGREPAELVDVVLHEILHVSDTRPFFPPSVFKVLDKKLVKNGVRGKKTANARHVLFYMLAGELVRRYVDPEHVDHGETSGFYGRAEGLAEQLQPLARGFLTGEIEGGEFTDSYTAVVAAWFAQGGVFLDEE